MPNITTNHAITYTYGNIISKFNQQFEKIERENNILVEIKKLVLTCANEAKIRATDNEVTYYIIFYNIRGDELLLNFGAKFQR